jgi:hypothetical protein
MQASTQLPSVQFPFASYIGTLGSTEAVAIIVAIGFILWIVYTLVVSYHWLRYGRSSIVAIPALAVHIFVSLSIALYALSALR